MKKTYITIEGEVKVYNYVHREVKSKPKCPSCSRILKKVYYRYKNGRIKNIGYICLDCNFTFIDSKFKIFRIKIEK